MLKLPTLSAGLLLLGLLSPLQKPLPQRPTPSAEAPVFTASGDLVAPVHYREWIYLTSGLDMSYASAAPVEQHIFDNVFVNPASYHAFLATGHWPDDTTFVLEIRAADNPVSINKRGHTQGATIRGTEIHVKTHGQWTFYDLPAGAAEAKLIPPPASCYTCHEAHAAVDTTFAQFYPTLLPTAQQKGTLSPAYLKEIEAPAK